MSNKTFSVEHGAFIDNEVDIHGATPLLKLTDTDTTDLQHTLSSSAGLVISADVNNAEASTTIDFAIDGATVGVLDSTGSLDLSSATSPHLKLTDTTNTVETQIYSQNVDAFVGTTSSHPLKVGTNNTAALTLDTSQNATMAGTLDVQGATLTLGVADTTGGILTIHGNGTGNAEGGEIRLATAADHDTTYEFYRIDVIGDDFRIGRQGQTDLQLNENGRFGINETTPETLLHVTDLITRADVGATQLTLEGRFAGYGAGIDFVSRLNDGGSEGNIAKMATIVADGDNAWSQADTATQDSRLTFFTTLNGTPTERMRISSSGLVTITGDLTVTGSTTTFSTTNTTIADQLIELGNGNTGAASGDAGLIIERGDDSNAFMGFDESADQFVVATTTATGASTGDLTLTDANFRANQITTTYANNSGGVMRNIYESTSNPTAGDGQVGDVWIVYNV